jgi:hypothetical protein
VALSEQLCWDVMRMAEGKTVSSVWLKGEHSKEPPIQNAAPLFEIERNLVLRFSKSQVEDSLYFLEKRGYLIKHGFQGLTRVCYQLSKTALAVLRSGAFPSEEQKVFRNTQGQVLHDHIDHINPSSLPV